MESNIQEIHVNEQHQDYQLSDIWQKWGKPNQAEKHLVIKHQEIDTAHESTEDPHLITQEGGCDSLVSSNLNLRIRAPASNSNGKRLKMGSYKV